MFVLMNCRSKSQMTEINDLMRCLLHKDFFLIREYRYHIIFKYLVTSLSHGALTRAGNKAVGVMKAGQTFTIEPMINSGRYLVAKPLPCV